MTSLLAFDPGGTTGWSLWDYTATTPLTLIDKGQIGRGLDGFVEWCESWSSPVTDEIVSESFVLDGRTASPDITPLHIEGAMRVIFGPRVIYQRNAQKAHADDLLLKRHDLWFVGQPHATDSARHAIALMKLRRHAPSLRRFWPPRRDVAA